MNEALITQKDNSFEKIVKLANMLIQEIPVDRPLFKGISKPEQFATLQQWKKMLSKVIDNYNLLPKGDPMRMRIIECNDRVLAALSFFDPKQGH